MGGPPVSEMLSWGIPRQNSLLCAIPTASKPAQLRKGVKKRHAAVNRMALMFVAEWTGLEPATPGVTGRYSNQLNYHSW